MLLNTNAFEPICTAPNIPLQYSRHSFTGTSAFILLLSHEPSVLAKFVTLMVLLTEANAKTTQKALCLQLLSRIAKVQHNADKQPRED